MKRKKVRVIILSAVVTVSLVACSNSNAKLINQPVFERYGLDAETGKLIKTSNTEEQQEEGQEDIRDKNGNRIVKETSAEVFTYEIKDEKVVITGLNEFHLKEIKIPSKIDGFSVVGITGSIFSSSKNLEYVELPNTMTYIGESVFDYATKLQEVIIPDSIITIGDEAFSNCSSLESIKLPKNLETIGGHVFSNCKLLNNVVLPGKITKIGEFAFANCSSLETIELNIGITEIGQQAFQKCESLKEVVIPKGVKAINIGTFYGCSGLERIEIPKSVEAIYPTAFTGCDFEKLTIVAVNNSFAYNYAMENDMNVTLE